MKKAILTVFILMLFAMGCASIIHSNTQYINFNSEPADAIVYVDGKHMGGTPLVLELSTEQNHEIKIMYHGKTLYQTTLDQVVSQWFWGNFITILPFGMIVDYATGSMYRLEPGDVNYRQEDVLKDASNSPVNSFILKITSNTNAERLTCNND
ncbi:MAG: PEGA domain-containing protein [Candidatus Zixiibacteriota bacterium]